MIMRRQNKLERSPGKSEIGEWNVSNIPPELLSYK